MAEGLESLLACRHTGAAAMEPVLDSAEQQLSALDDIEGVWAERKRYAIAVHYRALKFLIHHGEEIWPQIPILFCGVEKGRRDQLKALKPNITGIFADARFGETFER